MTFEERDAEMARVRKDWPKVVLEKKEYSEVYAELQAVGTGQIYVSAQFLTFAQARKLAMWVLDMSSEEQVTQAREAFLNAQVPAPA